MKPACVIVVGSANVDLVMHVPRLPRPGETVIGGVFSEQPGGKGANQAAAAAKLGARTWFVGKIGDDDLGRATREDLEGRGIDCSELGTGTAPTGVAQIWVDAAGHNAIAVASGANSEVSAAFVRAALGRIDAEDAVVLANLEIPDEAVIAAAEEARSRSWRFVLNPAPARALADALLAHCDVLTPNEHELVDLAIEPDQLLARGLGAVVVTRGARGADLYRANTPVHSQPAFRVDVRDTTGAGDAFSGALAWALASGAELEAAIRIAAAVGALATRALGARTSLPGAHELDALLA